MTTFFQLLVISENCLRETCVDSTVTVNLTSAYHLGNLCSRSESVYGYVVIKHSEAGWEQVADCVHGCDYSLFEADGVVRVKVGQ